MQYIEHTCTETYVHDSALMCMHVNFVEVDWMNISHFEVYLQPLGMASKEEPTSLNCHDT